MTIADWLMVLAVLVAPLVAVQVQDQLNVLREKRRRKLIVFQALLATRAARLSAAHVQALNSIDVEFSGPIRLGKARPNKADQAVLEAWKGLLDQFGTPGADTRQWADRNDDLFIELMYTMGRGLGYMFDKVQLRKGIYTPVAHGRLEADARIIRESLVQIVSGQRAVPIQVLPPNTGEGTGGDQQEAITALTEVLTGKRAVRVVIDEGTDQQHRIQ